MSRANAYQESNYLDVVIPDTPPKEDTWARQQHRPNARELRAESKYGQRIQVWRGHSGRYVVVSRCHMGRIPLPGFSASQCQSIMDGVVGSAKPESRNALDYPNN